MKMKKYIALALALVMSLCMVACGDKGDTSMGDTSMGDPDETPVEDNTGDMSMGDVSMGEPDGGVEITDPVEDNNEAVDTENTVGKALMADFTAKAGTMTAEELANDLLTNEVIQFAGAAMPVEPGYLSGFDAEITEFKSATMFAPMIGTIPFVGYIFELEDGSDVAAFEQNLKDNANLRWNICTAADEMLVTSVDNTVFFLMAPYQMEA